MSSLGTGIVRWIVAIAAIGAVAVVAFVLQAKRLPTGVEPVAWDREVCAQCRMHVGDPHFAVQLQTNDGSVLNFDDPGCFFFYESARHPSVHAVYFHHVREDRWLPSSDVAFVPVSSSPMGYRFGAVQRGAPGAITLEETRIRVLRGEQGREAE